MAAITKTKLLLLHERNVRKSDLEKIASVCPTVIPDITLYREQALPSLFDKFNVILIDISDNAQLSYYDTYKSIVPDNVAVIYLKTRGEHLDVDSTKKIIAL
jgi:hypothetical protein